MAVTTDALAVLRSRFPVLGQTAYLNAGTCGPLSWDTADVLADATSRAAVVGRAGAYFETLAASHARLRAGYADALGARPQDIAITLRSRCRHVALVTPPTEAIARVLIDGDGLDFQSRRMSDKWRRHVGIVAARLRRRDEYRSRKP